MWEEDVGNREMIVSVFICIVLNTIIITLYYLL